MREVGKQIFKGIKDGKRGSEETREKEKSGRMRKGERDRAGQVR